MSEPTSFLVLESRDKDRPRGLTRYEDDPYTWAMEQAALLREGRSDGLDRINLADEISDVSRREFDRLQSDLSIVLQHLLKWDKQRDRRSRSWVLSIEEHRAHVVDQFDDNPGLKSKLHEALQRGYRYGRLAALRETGLAADEMPKSCPYTWDDIMTREIIWPED